MRREKGGSLGELALPRGEGRERLPPDGGGAIAMHAGGGGASTPCEPGGGG